MPGEETTVQEGKGLGGKDMVSRRDSNYYDNYVVVQLQKERNANLIVDLNLLLLPEYSPGCH